jgi:hypothetical protein
MFLKHFFNESLGKNKGVDFMGGVRPQLGQKVLEILLSQSIEDVVYANRSFLNFCQELILI